MKPIASRLQPVLAGLGVNPIPELRVQHNGQIRPQPLRGPTRNALEVGQLQNPAGTLIGQHRVDVAVAYHHRAALQRRPYHRKDVLGLVSRIEQGLGARRHLARRWVQNNLPDHRSDGVSPGSNVFTTSCPALASHVQSRSTWVVLPTPSPPSKTMKTPAAVLTRQVSSWS